MFTSLSTLGLVAILIGVLITIHEFGHLIVAKLGRIPVDSFSIGFGPVILKRRIGETEYRLSLVPLGGYIKMVGEDNPAQGGFSSKPVGVRVAVVAAGPFFNLVLGFVLIVAMYLIFGVTSVSPLVTPLPGSGAEGAGLRAGDRILAVAGDTVPDFETLQQLLMKYRGKEVTVMTRRGDSTLVFQYLVPESLEMEPFIPPVIDRVRAGSPAARLGLRPGDRILTVGGNEVRSWEQFVRVVREHGGMSIELCWQRGESLYVDSIVPALEQDQLSRERFGQIGVWVRLPRRAMSLPQAVWEGARRTGYITVQTFVIIYKVITRKISSRAIGGPIMVAKIAWEGASWGWEYFLALWALLSINLFVVNMLPVPVLDGGRILLDVIAGVRRRPLSDRELTWANSIGWAVIGILVALTLFNDLRRLLFK
ncbi:MAG: RIP metalloprotease RseP [candidate division WOR-3 bacterium]|uniref:Zinc metalloprotease n=3 Tax=candidate division WOR-3 bacterium TaxID=2052148 RepID=A0A7C1SHR7_UNCW3|nr:RIP metalloprotease RseP [candidate division WOR-3 bacterium]